MVEEPAAEMQLLRSLKAKLIDILSSDADFVLQHAHSRGLLSEPGYQRVKACRVPGEKVTDLLDHILHRGPEAARGLLELLKDQDLQETFPLLCFVKDLRVTTVPSGSNRICPVFEAYFYILIDLYNDHQKFCLFTSQEETRKKKQAPETEEIIPVKKICRTRSRLVTEKQLMTVARAVGRTWREIGRLALDIPSVKLEQIEEDKSQHVERVFAMLGYWRTCQREEATAAHLHSLLSQDDWALPPERIEFLLETV